MCCFSRRVEHVSATRIFARAGEAERQLLAYSMSASFGEELAMVLPLPVPPRPPDDAVRFIDLSAYPKLFADLERAFPPPPVSRGPILARAIAPQPATLKVHSVGDFDASFVPHRDDFSRLDPRFRLPDVRGLERYSDWGFAVFKLKPAKGLFSFGKPKAQSIHPMAFEFPRRDASELFFPTVHVHDGEVHAEADFDHTLYCQLPAALAKVFSWQRSEQPAKSTVDAPRSAGLVDPEAVLFRRPMNGRFRNEDTVVAARELTAQNVLRDTFLVRAADAVARADALEPLFRARATEWGLIPWDPALPPRYPRTDTKEVRLPGGYTTLMPPLDVPCQVSWHVAPATVTAAFGRCPTEARYDEILAALTG